MLGKVLDLQCTLPPPLAAGTYRTVFINNLKYLKQLTCKIKYLPNVSLECYFNNLLLRTVI